MRSLILSLLFLVTSLITIAQNGKIEGKITDAKTGLPLPGVSVSVKNSTNPLYLGSYNGGEFSQWFNGRMGIVRYYSAALTGEQVLQNYNANRGIYGL